MLDFHPLLRLTKHEAGPPPGRRVDQDSGGILPSGPLVYLPR